MPGGFCTLMLHCYIVTVTMYSTIIMLYLKRGNWFNSQCSEPTLFSGNLRFITKHFHTYIHSLLNNDSMLWSSLSTTNASLFEIILHLLNQFLLTSRCFYTNGLQEIFQLCNSQIVQLKFRKICGVRFTLHIQLQCHMQASQHEPYKL